MKFKVGDKVRVREDLKVDKRYGSEFFVDGMERYRGKAVEIGGTLNIGYYLKEDDENWAFTDEMLEPITDPLAEKVLERNNKPEVSITLGEFLEEQEQERDTIQPAHYNKGEIDLFESAYRTRPFNEFRAIMEFVAERYMKRDKDNRIQDLDKAIYTLTRLKEYEEQNK